MNPGRPDTIVVVPTLNEEKYIHDCLLSLLPQVEDVGGRIIVVDGGSSDLTTHIVSILCKQYSCLSLMHNRKRLQASAVNLAAQQVRADILIRADAHAAYPANYIRTLMDEFSASLTSDSIVVRMQTVGRGWVQRAIAAAQNSWLGNGGAVHRGKVFNCNIDHGHHAAFRLESFKALGGYDESFSHNEDAEFDYRLIKSGGRILMSSNTAVIYYPRHNFLALARQYFNFGKGRARTILLHRMRPKLRQIAPLAILAAAAIAIIGAPSATFLVIPFLGYAAACNIYAAALAIKQMDFAVAAAGVAAMTMHLAWSIGFVTMICRHVISYKSVGRLL
jgi:succinoglycan biosynthesis protein ExoA